MKKFEFNFLGLLSIVAFCFALGYNIHLDENPYGYAAIFLLYAFESIRSYIEGLNKGVNIIKEIRGEI